MMHGSRYGLALSLLMIALAACSGTPPPPDVVDDPPYPVTPDGEPDSLSTALMLGLSNSSGRDVELDLAIDGLVVISGRLRTGSRELIYVYDFCIETGTREIVAVARTDSGHEIDLSSALLLRPEPQRFFLRLEDIAGFMTSGGAHPGGIPDNDLEFVEVTGPSECRLAYEGDPGPTP